MSSSFINTLTQRVSFPRLEAPAPSAEELELIYKSALRAPDHMMLRPWRYLVIEGEARNKLGQIFVEAAMQETAQNPQSEPLSDFKIDKLKAMPLRAPMIIVAIESYVEHPKVPRQEQLLSCGVGVGYMLLALQTLGYGGIWRTGDMAFNSHVYERLGLQSNESIVGFLYLGTPSGEAKPIPEIETSQYFQSWT